MPGMLGILPPPRDLIRQGHLVQGGGSSVAESKFWVVATPSGECCPIKLIILSAGRITLSEGMTDRTPKGWFFERADQTRAIIFNVQVCAKPVESFHLFG